MGGVERAQRLAAGVHAGVAVGADQLAGRPRLAAGLEIHRQESKVARDVAPAQLGVELDPIDDADRGAGQYMLAAQVPMTVAGEAEPGPPAELGLVRAHKGLAEAGGHIQVPRRRRSGLRQLLDVPPPQREHPVRVPARHHLGGAVESCQQASRGPDVRPRERPRRDQPGECVLLVEAAHLNDVLDGVGGPLIDDLKSVVAPDDRPHPEVDPCSELLVDTHLLATGAVTKRQRAVVEKAERQRLLDLVGVLAGHEHPRRVGLVQGDPRSTWIGRGHGERLQHGWVAALLPGGADLSRG